jgi:hypothetical protein
MKFLIQKINKEIRHDFTFVLLESIRFDKWLHGKDSTIKYKFLNTVEITEPNDIYPPIEFLPYHKSYVPIGSVDFVTEYLQHFYGLTPKPLNVPEKLFHYSGRKIFNGTEKDIKGKMFVKSNDYIKGTSGIWNEGEGGGLTIGNYQFSDVIPDIISEWRGFVYNRKLVGLQNYSGDFAKWPNVYVINGMIEMYKSAPIAYTLDIGISDERGTFVIECHDFFSCALYGFTDHKLLPLMFYKWFYEFLNKSISIKSNTI